MDKDIIEKRLARLRTALTMELPPKQLLIIMAEAQEAMAEQQIQNMTTMLGLLEQYGTQIATVKRMVMDMATPPSNSAHDD